MKKKHSIEVFANFYNPCGLIRPRPFYKKNFVPIKYTWDRCKIKKAKLLSEIKKRIIVGVNICKRNGGYRVIRWATLMV